MPDLVEQIRGLKKFVKQNEPLHNRIDVIAEQAQRQQDELHDLHGWKEDYRNQIKALEQNVN